MNKHHTFKTTAFEWIGPTLFVSASLLSQNPAVISVSLNVIANYLTDVLKGFGRERKAKFEIVVENAKSKTCKKISYEGDIAGIKELDEIVKEVFNE